MSFTTPRIVLAGTALFLTGTGTGYYLSHRNPPPLPTITRTSSTSEAISSKEDTLSLSRPAPSTIKQEVVPGHDVLTTLPDHAREIAKVGIPQVEQVQLRKSFISSTNYRLRVPNWVLERLTKEGGHMAPAGNNKSSKEAMKDTFYLSANIVPQDYNNNVWYWNRLELFVRDLTNHYDEVHVLTGPLWLPPDPPKPTVELLSPPPDLPQPTDPKTPIPQTQTHQPRPPTRTITYPVIGTNAVAVPTHLFKAVLASRSPDPSAPEEKQYAYASWVIPNAHVPEDTPLEAFQVGKGALERVAGFRVFERVLEEEGEEEGRVRVRGGGMVKDLCEGGGCVMMSPDDHRIYFLTRDMRNAKTLERVEKTLVKLEEQGLAPDVAFMEIMEKKVGELGGGTHGDD
ncbi:hypothetical protein HDV00_005214 [Rhizophlyctis rosea]|nr:hypothetical protein HDV00_005214 [Rhizophlyctis rosea]